MCHYKQKILGMTRFHEVINNKKNVLHYAIISKYEYENNK